MTAVSLVNVLRLLTIRVPRVPGANINEVPNSAVGQKNRGILRRRPQLELGCGPGRAKCARARPSFDLRKPTKPMYSPVAWSTARKKIYALFCPVPPRQPKTPNPRKNPVVDTTKKRQWRLHNCGNTTEATTLLQQFIKKKKNSNMAAVRSVVVFYLTKKFMSCASTSTPCFRMEKLLGKREREREKGCV